MNHGEQCARGERKTTRKYIKIGKLSLVAACCLLSAPKILENLQLT
jgi:hypothetical protein